MLVQYGLLLAHWTSSIYVSLLYLKLGTRELSLVASKYLEPTCPWANEQKHNLYNMYTTTILYMKLLCKGPVQFTHCKISSEYRVACTIMHKHHYDAKSLVKLLIWKPRIRALHSLFNSYSVYAMLKQKHLQFFKIILIFLEIYINVLYKLTCMH